MDIHMTNSIAFPNILADVHRPAEASWYEHLSYDYYLAYLAKPFFAYFILGKAYLCHKFYVILGIEFFFVE